MNHPNREELAEFLYEELAPVQQAEVARHLASCAECQTQVESWRAARRDLAGWKLPEHHAGERAVPLAARSWRVFRWAAAAAILISAGYGVARLTSSSSGDDGALRAEVARQVREEMGRQFEARFAQWTADQAAREQEFQAALTKAIGRLEARRLVDYADLRRDVETVALRAEDEFLTAQENLLRLASFEPAEPRPTGTDR